MTEIKDIFVGWVGGSVAFSHHGKSGTYTATATYYDGGEMKHTWVGKDEKSPHQQHCFPMYRPLGNEKPGEPNLGGGIVSVKVTDEAGVVVLEFDATKSGI